MAPLDPRYICWVCAGLCFASVASAQLPSADASTAMDCGGNLIIDRKQQRFSCERGIQVTQGNLTLKADSGESNSLDIANSILTFTNNVRINGPNTEVTADQAVLKFVDKRLLNVRVVGQPAHFEQITEESPDPARGHANSMNYDLSTDIITLTENAFLSQGQDEISGETITYDVQRERVVADSDGNSENRVRLIITPDSQADDKDDETDGPP